MARALGALMLAIVVLSVGVQDMKNMTPKKSAGKKIHG
jgi:hypothetical protein